MKNKFSHQAFALLAACLLAISCKGFSGVFTDDKPAAFIPGSVVNLPTASGGFQSATVVDMNGDGVADGLDLDGNGIPEILYVSLGAERAIGLDLNGDGVIDYYLVIDFEGNITLQTVRSGGSKVKVTTDTNGATGFDTNGTGGSPANILAQIRGDSTAPTIGASPAGGTFSGPQSITLTCSDSVACNAVAFTSDGSDPNFAGQTSIIVPGGKATRTISSTTTVRYITRDAKGNVSGIGQQVYTISGGGGGNLNFTPSTGPIGTLITLTATGSFDFSTLTGTSINGTAAVVVSTTANSAQIIAMPNSTTGNITATNASETVNSLGNFTVSTASNITTQQGSKLVGTGATGAAVQGISVSLSADGNTAIVGGYNDNANQGAAWIFIRSGTSWAQQGTKLVGTGNIGPARQGVSVALSADGNTALIGGYQDNSNQGAVWVFTRSGATWAQQGTKLVGTGNAAEARQGSSVALSADGNTAVIGGPFDNSAQGAGWVFVRSGINWTQQGTKLLGTGNTGAAYQGFSVALSADGNTALLGGYQDNSFQGAFWVFTRSGTTWTQQGTKLVGTGNTGAARQGFRVALSADGNTAIIGGNVDNSNQGAAWKFRRSGVTWSQQGTKLVGAGNVGTAQQGGSVAIAADGRTAFIGGTSDNTAQGAVWVFVP